jgi:hypothetical protein
MDQEPSFKEYTKYDMPVGNTKDAKNKRTANRKNVECGT